MNMNLERKVKKLALKLIKPFLPFIIIILVLFFLICSIIDAVFVQEVQKDSSYMSKAEQEIKRKCIEKAEYLNTCHNLKDNEETQFLLDIDNREINKEVEWSHLYAILAFNNMSYNSEINEELLNEISKNFESTFTYETIIIKEERQTTDEEGNPITITTETPAYILIESDTIKGHYKYNYEEKVINTGNSNVTRKVFIGEEMIGEKYDKLRDYLKNKLKISEDEIENDVEIVIQAANGYYNCEENTEWLQR